MAEMALGAASAEPLLALRQQAGPLWPWLGRFWWQPALDLHPQRRAALAPLPSAAWEYAASAALLSRHVQAQHHSAVASTPLPCWQEGAAFRLALLPQPPLAQLARRLGLALGGNLSGALTPDEAAFVTQRAPLYWRASADSTAAMDAEAMGWGALLAIMAPLPPAVQQQFRAKTALQVASVRADADALGQLAQRILREFEEPWSYLFVTSPA